MPVEAFGIEEEFLRDLLNQGASGTGPSCPSSSVAGSGPWGTSGAHAMGKPIQHVAASESIDEPVTSDDLNDE